MLFNKRQKLESSLQSAMTYSEWKDAAIAYDEEFGLDRWKRMDQSKRYDYVSLRIRLDKLRGLRARHDDRGILFTLNEGIHGNMGGMGAPRLYAKSKFGTKQLVIDYVDEIVMALEHIADPATDSISLDEKEDFFRRASHCFGRSALMLSGAGSLLYFHVGVVKALWEQRQLPNILSGSSGGAIVCALLGTHTDEELKNIFDPKNLAIEIHREAKLLKYMEAITPQQMESEELYAALERMVPDMTFGEALELTGRHINITVAPAEPQQTSRLLNATTSPNVYIREALMASCAVPGVFPPVTLAAKNIDGERQAYLPSRRWVDGSVADDLPAKRLARLYGVNHYIVSQTNPLVLPFINDHKLSNTPMAIIRDASKRTAKEWVKAGVAIAQKPLSKSPGLTNLLNLTTSVIRQEYTADINILPTTRIFNPLKLLASRSEEEIIALIDAGERAAWPKVEMIRIQTQISRTLDKIMLDYGLE